MQTVDMTQDIPNTEFRLIFNVAGIGWVRGWFGDSYLEGAKYAGELAAYDVRIIRNATGETAYERAAQFAVNHDRLGS